jgi:hypothetical protein
MMGWQFNCHPNMEPAATATPRVASYVRINNGGHEFDSCPPKVFRFLFAGEAIGLHLRTEQMFYFRLRQA